MWLKLRRNVLANNWSIKNKNQNKNVPNKEKSKEMVINEYKPNFFEAFNLTETGVSSAFTKILTPFPPNVISIAVILPWLQAAPCN